MENRWNLKILFANESTWREALNGLPSRVASIREIITRFEAGGVDAADFLEDLFTALEEMVRISARAEIWLSRMIALHPVDPYYAKLSDFLDVQEIGELPLMKEIQRVLRGIPDLDAVMGTRPHLQELLPWCRHLCQRIIALETLDSESGGGWYRLRALLDHASVEWQGEEVSFRDLLEENGFAEWGEEIHECVYELFCSFYEAYGQKAADILIDVLRRDEEDYLREGADSLTVYLRDYGLSMETLSAMTQAVEEGLPAWYECKRNLDRWHRELAEAMEAEEITDEEEGFDEDPSEDTDESEQLSDEEIEAQNLLAYDTLKETILEQFADFHPEFSAMVREAFEGNWVWINDDPLAYRDQHASMIPELGLSYISLAADCYLPAAAHELGHAWHNRCLRSQNILYNQNELLMELPSNLAALWSYRWSIDHRYDSIADLEEAGAPEEVLDYYRKVADSPAVYEEMLSETVANIYDGYASFCFERELRSRITGEELTADDISAMYLKYRRKLLPPEHRDWKLDPFRWIERGSIFSCRSYYNLPYMMSILLAYRLLGDYESCREQGCEKEFWSKVTKLLRRMNAESTETLLTEIFGESVQTAAFWRECMKNVEKVFAMTAMPENKESV